MINLEKMFKPSSNDLLSIGITSISFLFYLLDPKTILIQTGGYKVSLLFQPMRELWSVKQ